VVVMPLLSSGLSLSSWELEENWELAQGWKSSVYCSILFRLALPAENVGGKVEQAGQSHILNQNFLIYIIQ